MLSSGRTAYLEFPFSSLEGPDEDNEKFGEDDGLCGAGPALLLGDRGVVRGEASLSDVDVERRLESKLGEEQDGDGMSTGEESFFPERLSTFEAPFLGLGAVMGGGSAPKLWLWGGSAASPVVGDADLGGGDWFLPSIDFFDFEVGLSFVDEDEDDVDADKEEASLGGSSNTFS